MAQPPPFGAYWIAIGKQKQLSEHFPTTAGGISQKYSVPLRSASTKDKLSILAFQILKKCEFLFSKANY